VLQSAEVGLRKGSGWCPSPRSVQSGCFAQLRCMVLSCPAARLRHNCKDGSFHCWRVQELACAELSHVVIVVGAAAAAVVVVSFPPRQTLVISLCFRSREKGNVQCPKYGSYVCHILCCRSPQLSHDIMECMH
jgi:hypothetical protein